MKGRDLIKKAFQLEKVERIPWVPFVGCHGSILIGKKADEYLKSADNIVAGINEAIKRYRPDGIPVMFDLQVEAEALGCNLEWAENSPPAVSSHPLAMDKTLDDLKVPGKTDGRIGMVMEASRRLREENPDIAIYGLLTGPFTLALHLLGTDIFMKMFEDEAYVHQLLDFAKEVSIFMANEYIENGCDIIAMVDPMTSQISPEQFNQFITKPATEIFDFIRSKDSLSSFFVCGYAQQNIEEMCFCKPDNIAIDENIPLDYVKEVALKNKISFAGNLKLTIVLLMGTQEDCQTHAMECMELGGRNGFVLAPGCDLPFDTPPENLEAITNLIYDPYQQDVIKALEKKEEKIILPNMSDYGRSDKVMIDIITLDSESCAPCQYMVEAVKHVTPEFEGIVEWREHAIKDIESVTFMSALMVKNLPTICIDGKIAFVSKIPPRQDLIDTIQNRINQKLKLKIKEKKAEILVIGTSEDECIDLESVVKTSMDELGVELIAKRITDKNKIEAMGVSRTPAIMMVDYKLKSQGTIPSADVVKEWIKEVI